MINFTVFLIKSKLWIWSTLWTEFVRVKSPHASKVLLLTFHYHQNEMEAESVHDAVTALKLMNRVIGDGDTTSLCRTTSGHAP